MHMCCAPCAIYPVSSLKAQGHIVDGLYYNPNIHPHEEFIKREEYLEKLAEMEGFFVHYMPDFKQDLWDALHANDERKCRMCYELRLKQTFQFAKERKYDAVTTSLLVSPYQKHELIVEIALKYAKVYGVEFFYEDFRVGYKEGQKKAKDFGLYCQRYCGCILSLKNAINEISVNFKREQKAKGEQLDL